mgnify:CR=1 FL=1
MKKLTFIIFAWFIPFLGFGQTADDALWQAVKNNQLAEAQQAIAAGAKVNVKDAKNVPLFWWAILKADLPLIKYLISKGADYATQKTVIPCGSSCYYGSMLAIAIGENKLDVIKYLIEELKIRVNEQEWNPSKNCFCGWSPLQWSLNYKYDVITAYLIKQGANFDNLDKNASLYKASLKALANFKKQKYLWYKNLKQALDNPLEVYYLDLTNEGIEELPKEIATLKNLKTLNLNYLPRKDKNSYLYTVLQEDEGERVVTLFLVDDSKKPLRKLPQEIGQLTHLEKLLCAGNQLTVLPKEIGQLKKLKNLDCSNNQLTRIPKEIGQLVSLKKLNYAKNRLTALPTAIGKLRKLKKFNCSDNRLVVLPQQIRQLKRLEKLNCSNNRLTVLPQQIGQLKRLENLDCAANQLTALPPEIEKLSKLKDLDCADNQLTTLPQQVGQLKKLQYLNCSDNQLTTLLKEIRNLKKLEWLRCKNNQLKSLPKEIKQLKKLEYFDCAKNPFEKIPPELFDFLKKLKYGESAKLEKMIKN